MRLLISLLFCCGVLYSPLFGISSCETHLTKLSNQEAYRKLGIELETTRPKIRERLESTPAELLSPKAPSFEELEKLDLKSWKIKKQLPDTDPFADPKSLGPLLKLFDQPIENADYLFVGNGYYIPYLMARSAFAGTPMESRIKFVAFSRDLAKKSIENTENFSTYFKSLGIDTTDPNRKWVIIDSITSLQSGNDHSVIRTSNAVRNYLAQQGWPRDKANQSVITLGMPEGNPSHSYRTQSLEDYFKKLAEHNSNGSDKTSFPYFDPGITFDQSPFKDSYNYTGEGDYWNGKYYSLDNLGIPRGIEDIRLGLERIPARELDEFLWDRASKASFYQEIISKNKANASLYQKEIAQILKRNRVKP